jgi:3-hydroxyanthranilate 3,4-dioxygenase
VLFQKKFCHFNPKIMEIRKPFNLQTWIAENRHLLKPPVANKNLYPEGSDYIVMIVGGPNARRDYHYNETEELFYQLEGEITVKTQQNGQRVDVKLGPGDMFLLPAGVPHNPGRTEGSIGLVIERVRAGKGFTDGLLWFCDNCNNKLHEAYFELKNIETDFLTHFNHYYDSEDLRTCKECGEVMPRP